MGWTNEVRTWVYIIQRPILLFGPYNIEVSLLVFGVDMVYCDSRKLLSYVSINNHNWFCRSNCKKKNCLIIYIYIYILVGYIYIYIYLLEKQLDLLYNCI